jgi:hypothetical protein
MNFVLYIMFLFQVTPIQSAFYHHSGPALLPDPLYTPGIVRTTDKNVVCHQTTKAIRQPGIQAVYTTYHATKKPGVCCEIDHLIPLELGGDNGPKNEWPQPYLPVPGAHEKDKVENWLHAQVCTGKMELVDAQKQIATDWYAVYLRMKGQQ